MTDDSTQVLLVRHGETVLNAGGRLRGRLDPDLNDVGRREVAALARALVAYDVRTVYTSPLLRARRTARAIADACAGNVEIDERLNDRDYGQWAGQLREDVLSRWGSIDAAPGVEPAADVVARAMAAFADLAGRPGTVLVAHDAINQLLLQQVDPSLAGPPQQHTACWNVLERNGGQPWRIIALNQIAVETLR
ncbi:histidine phosphatase family protein [Dermatophilaceae bacterium Sec6.4]